MGSEAETERLPQPSTGPPFYRYILYERVRDHVTVHTGSLVWVCKSKGRRTPPQLYRPAKVVQSDDDDRVTVQYGLDEAETELETQAVSVESSSTYRVRKELVLPVVDASPTVLVCAETKDYRKACVVHTQAKDHFIEIGCDMGVTVGRVASLRKGTTGSAPLLCLGLDKCPISIAEATKRAAASRSEEGSSLSSSAGVPDFAVWDALLDKDWPAAVTTRDTDRSTVLALDLNGTREWPAVQSALDRILEELKPRLVIVKARSLHALLLSKAPQQQLEQ